MLKTLTASIPHYLKYLISFYLTGLVFFTIPRLILLFSHSHDISDIPTSVILQALVMGYRFDTVISGYLLALPALSVIIIFLFNISNNRLNNLIHYLLVALYSISFLTCSANIPYFHQFNSNLTVAAFTWADTPGMMFNMVFQDLRNYPYLGLFLLSVIFFVLITRKIRKRYLQASKNSNNYKFSYRHLTISILALGLIFLGIRGRITKKSPIRWGTAFFSPYPFPNQLGLNPNFTLIRSWLDARNPDNENISFVDDKLAISNVRKALGITNSNFDSPIARKISPANNTKKHNVVLVIMESMSAKNMERHGNSHKLTPVLDRLARKGCVFDNFYSSGTHTFNGIYSTLFGFPTILSKHPMKHSSGIQPYTGVAKTLTENDYKTIFFCTHDEQFDNMGGFLSFNGFQQIVSQKDYPAEKVLSTLGVTDNTMFDFAIPYFNDFTDKGSPFFATFLTGSNHPPFVIPDDITFSPTNKEIEKQIIEFSDWCIGYFLDQAKKQSWFDNTIFIFLGDHGAVINPKYDLALSYHHIPFIIYAPEIIEFAVVNNPGGQIDTYPTIMGLLNIAYVNNTLGIDLLKETRPYIFFNADETIGCLNEDYYLVLRKSKIKSLYHYRDGDISNYISKQSELVDEMTTYTYSMLQTTQWMVNNKLVKKPELIQ